MATATELMAAGMPAGLANMEGQDPVSTINAAGTTQATATSVVSSFTIVATTVSSSGVVLMSANAQPVTAIYNKGANTLKVYANGSETINGIAGSTGVSVATAKGIILVASNNAWISVTG